MVTNTYERVQAIKASMRAFFEYTGDALDFGLDGRRGMFGILAMTLIGGLAIAIFFSAWKTAIGLIVLGILWLIAARPDLALAVLLVYLPFEPFILKWLPDEIYFPSRYLSETIIYLIALRLLPRVLLRKRTRTPIDTPFILLGLALAASALINFVHPFAASAGIRMILRFILLFFLAVELRPTKIFIRRLVIALLVIVALQSALGLTQAVVGAPLDDVLLPSGPRFWSDLQLTTGTEQLWVSGQRISATLGRYDQLGTFLALFLLIAAAWTYERPALKTKLWLVLLMVFGLGALLLTYSRSAWFGFLAGVIFLSWHLHRDRRIAFGLLAGVLIVIFFVASSGLIASQLIDAPSQTILERFLEAFSYDRWRGEYFGLGRLFWIVETLRNVLPHAPILGWGPGTYGGGAAAALHNTRVYDTLALPFGVYGTEGIIDNNWFSLLGELGLIGFGFFVWMYGTLLRGLVACGRAAREKFGRALAWGTAGGFIALGVNAFLATAFEFRTLAPYLWTLAGFALIYKNTNVRS